MGQRGTPLSVVGKDVERMGALDLVLGKTKFSDDIRIKGILHLKVLRSPFSHALIKAIDTEPSSKLPGVVRIFTEKDIPGKKRVGTIIKDQPILAEDKVRYKGDPIALVAAETEDEAEETLGHIKIHYEELEPILTPERALEGGAPKIHETGNLLSRQLIIKGDVEKGFRQADIIVERTYTTPWVEHACLEPHSGIAYTDDQGRVTLCVSTQNPFYDQKEVADTLGLEPDRVRVIQAPTGGGFGSKLDVSVQCYLGLAAFHLKRPVKLVFTQEEAFETTSKRHPMKIQYKIGVTKGGKLTAVQVRILGDTGAYASYGSVVTTRAVIHAVGPYEVPNVSAEGLMVYTNNIWSGAMRGFGAPQVAFAHESQMDILAEELGMDPIDFRLKNVLKKGASTGTGQILDNSVGIGKTLERLKEWREKNITKEVRLSAFGKKGRIARGIGVASIWFGIGNAGASNPSTTKIEVDREGKMVLFIGTADIGQGSNTVLTQIAAEELGIGIHEIHLVCADTALARDAGATAASRQTYISGNAVRNACMNLKEILFREVRDLYDLPEREFLLRDKKVISEGSPNISISLTEIADRVYGKGRALRGEGFFNHDVTPLDPRTGQGKPHATYAFASQLAEVEVDRETGEVRVLRIVAAHDVGKAIHPVNVIGQICGGVAMGVGFALSEEFIPGQTNSYFNYFIPTIKDIPEIVSMIVEDEEPTGPFGAKGIGEPALIPTAPAILNGIAKAIGARIYDLPATLERVRNAAQGQKKEMSTVDQT